jgi:hypothetical protein
MVNDYGSGTVLAQEVVVSPELAASFLAGRIELRR